MMTNEKKTPVVTDRLSFEVLLNETCDRLWDTKVQYSIRRIRELDCHLALLEKELESLVRGGHV
jgi:hypothetical protein